jgi:hypothetical protein
MEHWVIFLREFISNPANPSAVFPNDPERSQVARVKNVFRGGGSIPIFKKWHGWFPFEPPEKFRWADDFNAKRLFQCQQVLVVVTTTVAAADSAADR